MGERPLPPRRQRLAVVGGGVAGIVAAYLLDRHHDVTLFEQRGTLGGHTNTFVIPDGPDAGTPIDTGFIVTNDRTYPLFQRFLQQLGVALRPAEMSFGFHCKQTGLQYATRNANTLFAQRRNLARPSFLKMLADIVRFNRVATADIEADALDGATLGAYLDARGFRGPIVDHYLIPMGSAIWSVPQREVRCHPAAAFLKFFHHHGLLSVNRQPQWQTVVGGSHVYLHRFAERFGGTIRTSTPIRAIARHKAGATVHLVSGESIAFDGVVVAAHADQALQLLADPSEDERRLLGAWSYQRNHVVLHTDIAALPPQRRAWASWNFTRESPSDDAQPVSVTYDMNRLQGITTQARYCVSLNPRASLAEPHIIYEVEYTHPVYTFAAIASQARLPTLNGKQNTYFCGSYFGSGFHEDAVRSGVAVARCFGIEL